MGAALALAACSEGTSPPATGTGGPAESASSAGPVRIGLLLPLSGRNAGLGRQMANAAILAVPATQKTAQIDLKDSDGAGGASAAARAAIGAGDQILLGPLTAGQTAEVSGLAVAAGIPELAYTSDPARAQEGVWVMGLTPDQQVSRLVAAAHAEGRKTFAAFLPDTAFGRALGAGLIAACAANGVAAPNVVYHASDAASIQEGLKTLSAIEERQAQSQSPAQTAASPDAGEPNAVNPVPDATPDASAPPASASAPSLAPPPFDALLLGDTGLQLATVITALRDDKIDPATVRIMGPALWGAFASKLGALHGAWFAAPDPASRASYVQAYRRRYGLAPTPMADVAYDTAAVAGALAAQPERFSPASLMREDGFAGVDGVFILKPGGHVARALAIFTIQPGGGASIAQPAPRTLTDTPS
ncbi:penicillin-binding protein activator [Acidomonas methanolica]|nr:penicillin-binding protein activator [Acidomonas methanolica]